MAKETLEKYISKSSPYFKELKRRLSRFLIFFFLFFALGFVFFRPLINFFFRLFQLGEAKIVFTSPFQVFNLAVNTGLLTAIVLSAPVLFFEFLGFVKPALKKEEKQLIGPVLGVSFFLFLLGFAFGLILMRWVVYGFSGYFSAESFGYFYDIEVFLSQVLLTSAFLGLVFEFPLLIYFLVKLKLIKAELLEQKRPLFIAGAFIFIALLPPADGFSLILMVLPVLLLYETTLWILKKGGDF